MTDSGVPVIDLVLTTRELVRLIRLSGLDLDQLEPECARMILSIRTVQQA